MRKSGVSGEKKRDNETLVDGVISAGNGVIVAGSPRKAKVSIFRA